MKRVLVLGLLLAVWHLPHTVGAKSAALVSAPTVPGEYEPVAKLVVPWDHSGHLKESVLELVAVTSYSAEVVLLIDDESQQSEIADELTEYGVNMARLQMLAVPFEAVWLRDYGAITVRRGNKYELVDFSYFGHAFDDAVPSILAKRVAVKSTSLSESIEGGNFLSNGKGHCVTSNVVLKDNPKLKPRDVRKLFRKHLGCNKTEILPALVGEDTGHVDMFMAFAGPKTVLVGSYKKKDDPDNAALLDGIADQFSRQGYKVIRIPMPRPSGNVFRTYLNLVVVNDVVLVPSYDGWESLESQVFPLLAKAYGGHSVVAIPSDALIQLGGALHCITMTLPK